MKNLLGALFVLMFACTLWGQDPGSETLACSFSATNGTYRPLYPMVNSNASSATFYGTTPANSLNKGTIFSAVWNGTNATCTTLFTIPNDGVTTNPIGRLVMDSAGNLYGVTTGGLDNGGGELYEFSPSTSAYTILFQFTGGTAGNSPSAVVRDSLGNFYVTTTQGGTGTCSNGCGLIALVKKVSGVYTETVLHNFAGGTADGSIPEGDITLFSGTAFANVSGGILLGTTNQSGANNFGTIYAVQLSIAGDPVFYKKMYDFVGGTSNLQNPVSGLYPSQWLGTFLGVAPGGTNNCGGIYEIQIGQVSATQSIVHLFTGSTDGCGAVGSLVADSAGNLYGATAGAGASSNGTAYKLTLNQSTGAWSEAPVYAFKGGTTDGGTPVGGWVIDGTTLFGVTTNGGANSNCESTWCGSFLAVPE